MQVALLPFAPLPIPNLATLEREEALGGTAQVTHLEYQTNVQAKKDVSSPQQATCI